MSRSLSGHCDACGADIGELCKDSCPDRRNDALNDASAIAVALREQLGHTMGDPVALTNERKKTHGDWAIQSRTARRLRVIIDQEDTGLSPSKREALDMIAVKISRILTGNPDEPDHWDDIAGYAHLGKAGHSK